VYSQCYRKETKRYRLLYILASLTFLILEVDVSGDNTVIVIHVNDVKVVMVLVKAMVFLLYNLWTTISKAGTAATRIHVEIQV
jgi:uncharacterized membrane protein YkvA (DUF1232 family)